MVKIAFYFLFHTFSDKQFIPGEPGYVEPVSVVTLYGEDVEESTPTTEPPSYADTDDDDEEEIFLQQKKLLCCVLYRIILPGVISTCVGLSEICWHCHSLPVMLGHHQNHIS